MDIILNDLLGFTETELESVKVRFQQESVALETGNPVEFYQKNPDIINVDWLLHRTKQKLFAVGEIAIGLLRIADDTWLLTTIKRITKDLDIIDGVNYEAEELEEYRKYYGRLVIKYHKNTTSSVRYIKPICDELVVNQILPSTFDGDDFPGYDKVRLTYQQLATIINHNKRDWIAALQNQKAVYLITDINTGKLYVGSATSESGMLLQRWSNYVHDGHGGNTGLKELVNAKGFDYVKKYFQYSILENYNQRTDDKHILQRESWWKETLYTRKFGYNNN